MNVFFIQITQNLIIIFSFKIDRMNKNNKIPDNCNVNEYVEMEKYNKCKPAIINAYFQTNLLAFIDKLPDDVKEGDTSDSESLPQESAEEQKKSLLGIKNAVEATKHEYDSMGDIQVNQYSITKFILGKGSHCFVKLGKKNGQSYAIKIISLDKIRKRFYIKEDNLTKMINLEILILKKLKHQNIIKFYEAICSVEKQRIFIVMENCSKGSLLKVIFQSATLPEQEWIKRVKRYFYSTIKGVQYIHQNNIIHRDIKAQNVLVDQNDVIKVIDFNISIEVPPSGKITLGKFAGTKTYAPPELLIKQKSERVVDGRLIDVWALGITLYQMIQRRHPFQRCANQQELIKEVEEQLKFPNTYNQDLRDLLTSMLKFENSERISTKQILKHPWLQGVTDQNIECNSPRKGKKN